MSWIELSTETTDEAIDWIRTLLAETHYAGAIRITPHEDSTADSPKTSSAWSRNVHLYLPDETRSQSIVQQIRQHLSSLQRTGMISDWHISTVPTVPDTQTASPIQTIGRFVILAPDVTTPLTSHQIPLTVGPSLAFGSGFHPATILCLHLLERYVTPGMNVLDLGCGSGILSVAMAKLGATVTAIDNDAIAVAATQSSVQQNGMAQSVTTLVGSLGNGSNLGHWMGGALGQDGTTIQPIADFDLIVANLFARIHLSLIDDYHQALRQDRDRSGLIITAGYDTDYEQEIDETFRQAGFQTIASKQLDNWVAFAHQKSVPACN